ncbi:MAG: hypothetical protein N838_05235 [Thiohalocapsa sp. PB-PSB1]|nr:MAG: hypothetical protein N838_05235 [Thiohalocapsa sp. PB-PSB1]
MAHEAEQLVAEPGQIAPEARAVVLASGPAIIEALRKKNHLYKLYLSILGALISAWVHDDPGDARRRQDEQSAQVGCHLDKNLSDEKQIFTPRKPGAIGSRRRHDLE